MIKSIELWMPVKGFEDLYEVSDQGRVRNIKTGRILKPRVCTNDYLQVNLSRNAKHYYLLVHRLVAVAFIPNPNHLKTVNHINHDRADNRVENLEWLSNADNIRYSRSKKVGQYTLDGELIHVFNSLREAELSTGIPHANISKCCRGLYKHAGGFIWRYV